MSLLPVTSAERDQVVAWIKASVDRTNAKGVLVANSGGADSACVTMLCVEALGSDRVLNVAIPIESVEHAAVDAHRIANWLGVRIIDRPLDHTFRMFMAEAALDGDTAYEGLNPKQRAILRGNVKARLRTTLARAWAEASGYIFVNTCNWSETVVGYDTKGGGDSDGDFGPLLQFVKWDVWEMLRLAHAPQWILDKVPSAELEVGQTDEADLQMSYTTLDAFARVFAAGGEAAVVAMEDLDGKRDRFLYLMHNSRHKRAAMPVFRRHGFTHDGT